LGAGYKSLSDRERTIFDLTYRKHKAIPEIAAELGVGEAEIAKDIAHIIQLRPSRKLKRWKLSAVIERAVQIGVESRGTDPEADAKSSRNGEKTPKRKVETVRTNRSPVSHESAEVELVQKALDVIGSPDRVVKWMQTALASLHGQTPYSLLGSEEEGRKQVDAVLGRIEHGIY